MPEKYFGRPNIDISERRLGLGMASQSQREEEVGDARFAELLKPIKDLTQNWNVSKHLRRSSFKII